MRHSLYLYAGLLLTSSCALYSHDANAQLLTGFSANETYSAKSELKNTNSKSEIITAPRYDNIVIYDQYEKDNTPSDLARNNLDSEEQRTHKSSASATYSPIMTFSLDDTAVQNRSISSSDAPILAQNAQTAPKNEQDAVDLQADNLSYNDDAEIVTAQGNVSMAQSGRLLRADSVEYSVGQDTVVAQGHVVLNERNGDIHIADQAIYKNTLKDGDVKNLRSTLNDGATFTAETGQYRAGTVTTMDKALYTPCIPCEEGETPTWALRASEVEHNKDEARVSYKNARLEFLGVPVAYTPYFSHSDGSIEQKSGFLSPSLGYKSRLGAFIDNKYYWAISPDQDATFSLMTMTEQAPLGQLEYRKRWNHANLNFEGGITSSERKDQTNSGTIIQEDEEIRGHILADALWDINDKWRAGLNVQWTSDDQYMRQYDFTNDDVLENELYLERFSGRNYASARFLKFQDIRVSEDRAEDQPDVFPEMIASFKGEPGQVPLIKGRWSLDTSVLGIMREGDEADMTRFSVNAGWKRRFVSDYGLLTTAQANLRNDIYYTNDRQDSRTDIGRSRSGTQSRFFPQFNVETSYPMAKEFEYAQARIEPVIALTAAPKIDLDDYDHIPNEDSNDVQIDASNLFERSRFPGVDRLEDQSRATYGMRTGLYGYDGSYANVFVGQSYRLDKDDNPFPRGSGLDQQESDVVGQFSGRYKDIYMLDYRYQLDSRNLTSQRHEIDASADWNRFKIDTRYFFSKGLEGTELDESREQIDVDGQFYFSPAWRFRSGLTHDFAEDAGLRSIYSGLDYMGQCLFLGLTAQKNYTTEASGEGDTEIMFRIGLKNLGDFEQSSYKRNSDTHYQNNASCGF
tara:strand:- start:1041 stop:3605 length:2565 start_codon:yes stop_codon:yes gene_type:complete